jgi:hypothetical protein
LTNALQVKYLQPVNAFADFRLAQATLVLFVSLTACSNAPELETRAFRGSFSGTTTVVAPGEEGSLDRCNANSSDGKHLGFSSSGLDDLTGEFTILGSVTIVASDCIHPETGRFAQGRATLRTASGDVLMTEFHGSFRATDDPDVEAGRGEHQITGGTGRYARAEGSVVCALSARVSTSEVRGNCSGVIGAGRATDSGIEILSRILEFWEIGFWIWIGLWIIGAIGTGIWYLGGYERERRR